MFLQEINRRNSIPGKKVITSFWINDTEGKINEVMIIALIIIARVEKSIGESAPPESPFSFTFSAMA